MSYSMRSPLKKSFDILARMVPGDSWIVPFLPTLRIRLAWSPSKTERWYKNWARQRQERQSRGLPDSQFVKRLNNRNSWKIMNFKSRNFVWKTPKLISLNILYVYFLIFRVKYEQRSYGRFCRRMCVLLSRKCIVSFLMAKLRRSL